MSLIDTTDSSQTDSISFELDLKHQPKKVWRALTDPELLQEWLLPVVEQKLELKTGATFTFQTQAHPGWDGTVNCRLLEIDAPKSLRYAWGVPGLDTVLRFTLTETASGTLLSVVQSGFLPTQKHNFAGARYGWNMMGNKLIGVLDARAA